MPSSNPHLPKEGDLAPSFTAETQRGTIHFPDYARGHWCILFAHPANFNSAWMMFNTFMALKERWFDDRNTKLIGIATEPLKQGDWSDRVRRYIDIYLKAPLIIDSEQQIAHQYGISLGRRLQADRNRLAFIIDPEGMIRLIIKRPIDGIESAIKKLEHELNRLQGTLDLSTSASSFPSTYVQEEALDRTPTDMLRPYYYDGDIIQNN